MRSVAPDVAPKAASFIVLASNSAVRSRRRGIIAFVDRREQFHQTILAAEVNLSRLPVAQFLQHATPQALAGMVASQAAVLAYDDAFFITGVLALLVTPTVLLLARKPT